MHKEPNEFDHHKHHEIHPEEQLADWEKELLGAATTNKKKFKLDSDHLSFLMDTLQKYVLDKKKF